ncbi:MAG: hypothetical protein J7L26_09180 [Candidatus Aminicenantes bacterium]|nr:hypothetical protein [Candidatus Aminicenantes bacterium]
MNLWQVKIRPKKLEVEVEERVKRFQQENLLRRLQQRDFRLWSSRLQPELTDRLGWLDLPERSQVILPRLKEFAAEVREDGVEEVYLLGMGGSSLAAEVLAATWKSQPDSLPLRVVDSTHPTFIQEISQTCAGRKTLFIVASKSGTTLETLALFRHFWELKSQEENFPGSHFVAITDEGTPLEKLALERGFRAVFHGPADVGGRFSALSVFGLLPGALVGLDVEELVERAREEKNRIFGLAEESDESMVAHVLNYLAIFALLAETRDKLTFFTSRKLESFPDWLEQLIAESLGKNGQGLVPVAREPVGSSSTYSADRVFIYLGLKNELANSLPEELGFQAETQPPLLEIYLPDIICLGAEMFRWEVCVALLGALLGVHPFNQPDVVLSKVLTREMLEKESTSIPESESIRITEENKLKASWATWLASLQPGDYISLQAWLPPTADILGRLQQIRKIILAKTGTATCLGFGPRFLHSTGQLHKGGPNKGVFLQLIDEPEDDLPVPETPYSFGRLIRAQADGDFLALKQRGRRVLRINLGPEVAQGLALLERLIS